MYISFLFQNIKKQKRIWRVYEACVWLSLPLSPSPALLTFLLAVSLSPPRLYSFTTRITLFSPQGTNTSFISL